MLSFFTLHHNTTSKVLPNISLAYMENTKKNSIQNQRYSKVNNLVIQPPWNTFTPKLYELDLETLT